MRNIRVLLARLGLDAHWRGSMVVARALRDAGMEVIYLGNQMPEAIVSAAIDEDVDVIGLSTLSGNHQVLGPRVMEMLKAQGADDITVVLGGTVSPEEAEQLKAAGMAEIFGPGSPLAKIVDFVSSCARSA